MQAEQVQAQAQTERQEWERRLTEDREARQADDRREDEYWTNLLGFPLTTRTRLSRRRWEEEPPDPPPGPRGLELLKLDWPLRRARSPEKPHVRDPAVRFAARFPKYIEHFRDTRGGETIEAWWTRHWTHIPYDALAAVFSPDELSRLAWSSPTTNEVTDAFEAHPYRMVLHKIQNSMWHWGCSAKDYNRMVCFYGGFRRFVFADGLEARLDHVNAFRSLGYAEHHDTLYLDGEFAFVIYRGGDHVLTIGFSVSKHGVLLRQVQLRQPKGNRWLFRLPKPLLEHVIDRFFAAFPGEAICLAEGASNVAAIRKAYGSGPSPLDAPGVTERVSAFYDQDLCSYVRGTPFEASGLRSGPIRFFPLAPLAPLDPCEPA